MCVCVCNIFNIYSIDRWRDRPLKLTGDSLQMFACCQGVLIPNRQGAEECKILFISFVSNVKGFNLASEEGRWTECCVS